MKRTLAVLMLPLSAVGLGAAAALWREVPRTSPDQVVELVPGVHFRHGDLEGHGHCNNGIIVFDEFVLIIDANFPSGADACLADVKKLTDKPARFVFDTHHHGDHAYGNPVWVKNGVVPVAHENVAREMARLEPARWRESMSRDDVKATGLDAPVPPRITFPDRMVIDDGKMRVELLHFGHAHTRGDGFAYLPKQKILFTGDAVVNGPYNFLGDGNTESWLEVIDALRQLDVEIVAPGHGPLGDRSLLDDQWAFLAALRAGVAAGIREGKSAEETAKSLQVPERAKRYVGESLLAQVNKVRAEMMGLETPRELEQLGLTEGPPMKKPGWTPPRKVVFSGEPSSLALLQRTAPQGLSVVGAPSDTDALLREVADADAVIGKIAPEVVAAGKKLRWVHSISAGVEAYVGIGDAKTPGIDALLKSDIVLTNGRRCYGPNIADQVFGYLLNFTRQMKTSVEGRLKEGSAWKNVDPGDAQEVELRGKTMVIVGLGGIGTEVARRARGFGMRIVGVDPKVQPPPRLVDVLYRPADLLAAVKDADVLVVACPLTRETRGMIGSPVFEALKRGAYLINVARGRIVDADALAAAARSRKLAGVGLDVTDPEPLPDSSPLWKLDNVIITPHNAGQSDGSRRRIDLLAQENIRRFAAGEPLLNVVDKAAGY